ncbi:protein MIZU-KUSSEI 1-like [Amaranthus tricolor]|uniref:protein MIZU-KUSSEI 1-like n=1 Tax=Amaranthus tricolor TaxID=29722 RepID=UPI002583C2F0|nr:protein MIZU-KUSSEI 1-like [Amaranthus tricolor]
MPEPLRQSPASPQWSPPPQPGSITAANTSSLSPTPSKSNRVLRRVRSVFNSFPNVTPVCRIPILIRLNDGHTHGGTRITGTLFGYRKARVNLAIQDNPRCLPMLLLELAIPTGKLLQDMGLGIVRIALESEKHPSHKTKLIEEPIWTMYCNGRKTGYGIKREPTDDDLTVIQMLQAVSMGAGVLPTTDGIETSSPDGELTYMRASFQRVVGSKDSETYYMMNPDRSSGPELSIFFVRV